MEAIADRKGVPGRRLGLFALFLACGVLVFPLAANYFSLYPTNTSTAYKTALPVLFLGVSILSKRSENLQDYWRITYAFFVASAANLMVWLGGTWLLRLVVFPTAPMTEMVLDKLSEAMVAIVTILVLTRLAGWTLGDLYLRRGNLRLGLGLALGFSIPLLAMFVAMGGLTLSWKVVLAALPAVLIYALINSLMEELWFRGLFLGEYDRLLGSGLAILLTAIVFTLIHLGMTYASGPERLQLLVGILYLGLATAFIMVKTKSIWGAVLLHTVADVVLLLGFFTVS